MEWKQANKVKFSTYLTWETAQAVKKLALYKGVPVALVIETALKKLIPERFYEKVN